MYPQAPDTRTEYHREGPLTISNFGRLWLKSGQPPLREGWRDLGGGWLRWTWFEVEGQAHALHVPSYQNSGETTDQEKKILGFLLGWMTKHSPDRPVRSSRVEYWLDQQLETALGGAWFRPRRVDQPEGRPRERRINS